MSISGRLLNRDELKNIWSIDRREIINGIYYYENGDLVLRSEHYDMTGWPPGEDKIYNLIFEDCFDHGGWFYALFDDDQMVGIAVLENRFIGREKDQLQLKFLMVSRDYRGLGLGRKMFYLGVDEARRRSASRLYISATPSEHTVNFYLDLGCVVTDEVNPELYELEPEDIHMEYIIG